MDEGPDAVPARGGAVEDRFDLRPVAEPDRRAGGVDDQLADEVAGDLPLVLQQQPLQLADVAELPAVGQVAGRVDRPAPRGT